MATNTTISVATAIAMCDVAVDRLDAGAGAGTLQIYDGTQPAGPDTAVGTQVLLATLTFSDPAFGAAVDANPGGRATAAAITSDTSADATGTASWMRCSDSTPVAHIDGSVGTASADLVLNTTSIVAGAEVAVTSHTVTQPES